MIVVIRGGNISVKEFSKKPREITTQDMLNGLSVYVGRVAHLNRTGGAAIFGLVGGYPGSRVTAVQKKWFNNTSAVFRNDPKPGQPNHCLLSEISIADAVKLFKSKAQSYTR